MSEKMTCPGCSFHSSSVMAAFDDAEPCPSCGLSAAAALEIFGIRATRADVAVKAQAAEAIRRLDAAETRAAKAERLVERMREVLDDVS